MHGAAEHRGSAGYDPRASVDASRWARSLGIAPHCTVSTDALEFAVGLKGSVSQQAPERVAAAAMSILCRLKQVAFVSGGAPSLPARFTLKTGTQTEAVELVAKDETDASGRSVLSISLSR